MEAGDWLTTPSPQPEVKGREEQNVGRALCNLTACLSEDAGNHPSFQTSLRFSERKGDFKSNCLYQRLRHKRRKNRGKLVKKKIRTENNSESYESSVEKTEQLVARPEKNPKCDLACVQRRSDSHKHSTVKKEEKNKKKEARCGECGCRRAETKRIPTRYWCCQLWPLEGS